MVPLFCQSRRRQIPVITDTKIEAITDTGVHAIGRNLSGKDYPADSIILATGMKARKDKVDELRRLIPETEVSIIGDCYKPRNIFHATHDGFNAAIEI